MEKYLGYSNQTIKTMICDRQLSLTHSITEMLQFPKDKQLYIRARNQAIELQDLIEEHTNRCDEIIE